MKPEPKTIKVVCTACGLDWGAHGAKPTLAKCVALLKAELAKKPRGYGQLAAIGTGTSAQTTVTRAELKAETG